ncbi:MAG TPA: response regulator [Bacteroidales bacterium]|nr:response regulator [Bacteroidales bacterium]HRZ48224.1 response regulator [Bacteroidales bacterium]
MNRKEIKILIADDDPDYLFQMKIMLQNAGFQVIAADSQAQAEEIIASVKPDLAILDLMMEKDDSGFILSYKIKKLYPRVPVILATAVSQETGISFGFDTEEDRSWIKADLYLEKGIRQDQLLMEIEKLLKK